ncbi:MAG: prenyltransferase/squalene oxidase repeat-containing protein, partial [Gemmataceae bacterium]
GIVGAPEAAPTNVPPPPGSGGGTGGALMDPNLSGAGSMAGTIGGMGGLYGAGGFGGRSGSTRQKLLAEGGGSTVSEAAVGKGLRFLALHQAPDGFWSLHQFSRYARTAPLPKGVIKPDNCVPNTTRNNDTAGTALGLLPFLAAGITNKPSKDNVNQADYSKGVGKALEWMIKTQIKTGEQRGYYGGDQYSHAIATIAMCEAYGLTSDPAVKASAQMGLNYIVMAQDPAGGGWRYSPRTAGDTSVTGWMVMALKSGQMAGLTVPKATLKKVEAFLNSCESTDKGGYGYLPNNPESPAMTAVGALCRMYLGVNPRNPSLLASIRKLKQHPPKTPNVYYTYYATQVMHHMGGEAWDFWNNGPGGKDGIRDVTIARQDEGKGGRPGQEGSFSGDDHVGGRIGATSLSLLSLEVYYRHLPLYRRDAGAMKDKP